MISSTLRGIFPEPQPTHKRNFVKENVKRIKQMQGILQNSDIFDQKQLERKVTIKKSVKSMSHPSKHALTRSNLTSKSLRSPRKKSSNVDKLDKIEKIDLSKPEGNNKTFHRGVQTDRPEDICSLYANGTIIYPSAKVLKGCKKDNLKKHGRGDSEGIVISNPHNEDLSDEMQTLEIGDKHDYIKENILALKNKSAKSDTPPDHLKMHQKGVIPKYLKDRKEEQKRIYETDPECPPGHVLLPDEERKETLRVLRQSYADRIKELNNMPVSNDTLRRRHRKMAIEEELKKIEEGIKVFQRPKVFVKINA